MKRLIAICLMAVMLISLSGCNKEKVEVATEAASTAEVLSTETVTDSDAEAVESSNAEPVEASETEAVEFSGTETVADMVGETEDNDVWGNTFVIEYPGEGAYADEAASEPAMVKRHWVEAYSKEANNIIDTADWLQENQFVDCNQYSIEGYYLHGDDYYVYRSGSSGGDAEIKGIVELYDGMMDYLNGYDFGAFLAANTGGDEEFSCESQVLYVALTEDMKTMFVSIAHPTYAEYYPDNAYIVALDTHSGKVLWKSEALVANAQNFVLKDDTIFCGYGFTDEEDYLLALDRYTGQIVHREELATGPEYIYEKNGQLYVRTYNTDYIFDIIDD